MTVMGKRWYNRIKRFLAVFLFLLVVLIIYLAVFREYVPRETDLDLTRRLALLVYASTNTPPHTVPPNVATPKIIAERPLVEFKDNVASRDSIVTNIARRIEEALKGERGSGCTIPKLDPFAKEVTQFDKRMPTVKCSGQDWVKCYHAKCKVIQPILDTMENIKCTYRDIIYESDSKRSLGKPWEVLGSNVYSLQSSDHVSVECTAERGGATVNWSGYTLGFRNLNKYDLFPSRDIVNILILGFDSTSKNGFIRRMPKSYKVLTEELEAVVLNGYNIVGDGTPAALFPILTGRTELELPDVRRKTSSKKHLDSMPFIFYRLKERGFRTAYFEDMPWIGTFQYRFNGFLKQPADHYLRAFFLEESSNGKKWYKRNSKYCVGDTPQYALMLNITKQFFELNGRKYCFTFIADITHDDFNMISTADDKLAEFLRDFKADGHLENTLMFVMGDHGPRYAKVRNTLQGKQEERLPLMAIVVPKVVTKMYPKALENLKGNVDVLTTPFDIHTTVLQALQLGEFRNNFAVKGSGIRRSLTLLEPIPPGRSCSEAGIEPHWCACLKWVNVSQTDPLYRRAMATLLDYINFLTEPQRAKCAIRQLLSIEWIMKQSANSKMLSFKSSMDIDGYIGLFGAKTKILSEYYQVRIVVSPGHGVYEASMKYYVQNDVFEINSTDISRTNEYGTEPSCISATHPHLNMYCYCND